MDLGRAAFTNESLQTLAEQFKVGERSNDVNKRARQEQEQAEIHKLSMDIARLNGVLNQEVQRRTETNKAIVGMFEAHMSTVQDKLEVSVTHRLDVLFESVEALERRVDVIEEDFASSQEKYHTDMEDKGRLVAQDIVALKRAFDAERTERKERETLLIAKLKQLQARSGDAMALEIEEVEKQVEELEQGLYLVGNQEDRRFHDFVFEELAALKTGLVQESQTREAADDEIVSALNHYTKSVQEAMRVINQA